MTSHYKYCPARRGDACLCTRGAPPEEGQRVRLAHMTAPHTELNGCAVVVERVYRYTVMVSGKRVGFMHVMHGQLEYKPGEEPNVMDRYLQFAGS